MEEEQPKKYRGLCDDVAAIQETKRHQEIIKQLKKLKHERKNIFSKKRTRIL